MLDDFYAYSKLANGYVPANYCVVRAFADVNLYSSYSVSQRLLVFASIRNLFDSPPPVDLGTYASNTSYNPSLAQEGAVGIFFDAGVRYRL
jgi:iron complex outermembrane receptor protein